MSKRLLIIGGTVTPYREAQHEHDKLLERFLAAAGGRPRVDAGRRDRPTFWFQLEDETPYFPFKTTAGLHHRAAQTTVTGLAELVLEREAAALGVTPEITTLDQVIDARWRLRDPQLFDRYDFVAISTTYLPAMVLAPVLAVLRIPERVKVFIGGPGVYKVDDRDLLGSRFDYVLRTEAEGRFTLMLRHALGEAIALAEIPGLTWREGGEVKKSDAPMAYVDMNNLPLPDYRRMAAAWEGRVIYESARGCPYRCEFCDYPFLMGNKKFRYKSAETIRNDWQVMHETMSVNDVLCLDSLFTFPPARLEELCRRMIATGLNKHLRWGCYARPDDVANRSIAGLMREAGCEYVYVGFESGAPEVLEFMNKKCNVDDNHQAVINCREVGIMCVGLFICGFPGETPELFERTRAFLRETPPFMLSLVPWVPDLSEDSRVPIMEPDRIERFEIEVDKRPTAKMTLYRRCTFREPITVPWGQSWKHRGMDTQTALDLMGSVLQEIYEGTIRTMSEELFLPRLLDDPLILFQRLGQSRALDFYAGLTRAALSGDSDVAAWGAPIGLRHLRE